MKGFEAIVPTRTIESLRMLYRFLHDVFFDDKSGSTFKNVIPVYVYLMFRLLGIVSTFDA